LSGPLRHAVAMHVAAMPRIPITLAAPR